MEQEGMQQGYIRLYRCLMEKGWANKPEYVAVWIYLLMRGNYRETETLLDGKVVKLKPGQLVTSRRKVSEETGVHESKIQRILSLFETEQQIEQLAGAKYRVISIVNWQKYQAVEQVDEQQMNSNRTANEQQMNTDKEVKKLRSKSLVGFDEFWSEYPRKVGKGNAERAWGKIRDQESTLMAILSTLAWQKKSDQWRESKFIPHPATYLNQRRWEDQPPEEKTVAYDWRDAY